MSSRLYQSVREKSGLAYAVSTYADFLTDSGLLGTYVAVSPENARAAVELILRETARVKVDGIRQSELESLKAQMTGGLMISMEGMTQRMSRLAKAEVNGRPIREIDAIISEIRAVSVDDIVRVLGELMQPGRICLAGLGPLDKTVVAPADLVL
jgi:predicted Zn-dependent peptidase